MIVIFTTIMKVFFNRILILLFAFAAIMAVVNSCSNIMPCNTQRVRNVEFSFAKISNKTIVGVSIDSVKIKGRNAVNDSVLYDTTLSNGGLALSMHSDTTTYFLGIKSVYFDTIMFHVKRELSVETSDCGFNYSFTILDGSYTQNLIDSVIVLNRTVSVDIQNNIQIVVRDTAHFRHLPVKFFK